MTNVTIEKVQQACLKSQRESLENRRKAIHNLRCSLEEIQPYENSSFLEFVGLLSKLLYQSQEKRGAE